MSTRTPITQPLREFIQKGFREQGMFNDEVVGEAIDQWNDGKEANSLAERTVYQIAQQIIDDIDKREAEKDDG